MSEELGMPTRVMLVEDHADFRHVMTDLLVREPDLEMVAHAESLGEARLELVIRAGNAVRINYQN